MRSARSPGLARIHAVLGLLSLLIGLQFLLLAVAVEAFLAGSDPLLWPAALASGLCCAASVGLARPGGLREASPHRSPGPGHDARSARAVRIAGMAQRDHGRSVAES